MTRVTMEQANKRIRQDWNIGKKLACALALPAAALVAGGYALETEADNTLGSMPIVICINPNQDLCFIVDPSFFTAYAKNLGEDEDCPEACEGNPINAATGNKFQVETDFVGGAATHLTLKRFYNSQATTMGAFGANWQDAWHRGLVLYPDGETITLTRADGRVDTFTNASGAWVADPDVTSRLVPVAGGWQLTTGHDDSVESYDTNGQLTSITTRAGLKTTLSYNGSQLATVTGPFGHKLSFAYDSDDRVLTMTAPDGGVYAYAYDSMDNLVSVTRPDHTTRYYLYENTSFPHALTGIQDEDGNRFATFAYDAQGKAVSTEHAGGVEKVTINYNSAQTQQSCHQPPFGKNTTLADSFGGWHSLGYGCRKTVVF